MVVDGEEDDRVGISDVGRLVVVIDEYAVIASEEVEIERVVDSIAGVVVVNDEDIVAGVVGGGAVAVANDDDVVAVDVANDDFVDPDKVVFVEVIVVVLDVVVVGAIR